MKHYILMLLVCITSVAFSQVTLDYKDFSVNYDTVHKVPVYSIYTLTCEEVGSLLDTRAGTFKKDPFNNIPQADDYDFYLSGYDRGHSAPSNDFSFAKSSNIETFYYTNVIPQNPRLNRGAWLKLEQYIRGRACFEDSILVITGVRFTSYDKYIGSKVYVPQHVWKALYHFNSAKFEFFMFPNDGTNKQYYESHVPMDSLERVLNGIETYQILKRLQKQ